MLKKNNSTNLSIKRKKLLFQSTHRGTKELDVLIGKFVSKHIDKFNTKDLNCLDNILKFNDMDLYMVLTKKSDICNGMDKDFIKKIIKFNKID